MATSLLEVVSVAGNGLGGSLPSRLPLKVRVLDLSSNCLGGSVPRFLFKASVNIRMVALSNNSLTGRLPDYLYQPQLLLFAIARNKMAGEVKLQAWRAPVLEVMSLSRNHFSGPLPEALFQLTSLKQLLLVDADFRGEIPKELHRLSNLQVVGLQGNYFCGTIPEALCDLPQASALLLADNLLEGVVPSCLSDHEYTVITLHDNSLGGSVPALKIGECEGCNDPTPSKGFLTMYGNYFSCDLPKVDTGGRQITAIVALSNVFTWRTNTTWLQAELPARCQGVESSVCAISLMCGGDGRQELCPGA